MKIATWLCFVIYTDTAESKTYLCMGAIKENPQLCRIFPFILSKLSPYFSFEKSRFNVHKSKEQTARVSLFKELKNVACIYTMESSFAGMDFGEDKGNHLTTTMLESLGRDLCRTLLIYNHIYVPVKLRNQF